MKAIALVLLVILILVCAFLLLSGTLQYRVAGGSNNNIPKILYHGSRFDISGILEPRPSKVINGEFAVFATPSRWLALVFISGAKNAQLDFGYVGKPYIAEMYPGAFDILRVGGYIYSLSGVGFHGDPRLGLQGQEFIKDASAKIVKKEKVGDVWGALHELAPRIGLHFVGAAQRDEFYREKGVPIFHPTRPSGDSAPALAI